MDEDKNRKEIMLRVSDDRYKQLAEVAKQAEVPVTTLCRMIVFDALDKGVAIELKPQIVLGRKVVK